MLELTLSGTPYEVGFEIGSKAKQQVLGSLAFYEEAFLKYAKVNWAEVQDLARQFEPSIAARWPAYLAEMRGIADGVGRPAVDILALNVRTEITFGQFSDGCTALGWLTPEKSFLGQNWDWERGQKPNLLLLTLSQPSKPTIKMVTEAGIIGKIGLNSAGVGVCLNAIRAKGMDTNRIPCHLGLRLALEASSRSEAISRLEKTGVAASCHMLIADASGNTGVEWSSSDVQKLHMNENGQVMHSNHYLLEHPGVQDSWPILDKDSRFRVNRVGELLNELGDKPSLDDVQGIFRDEANYPGSICRGPEDPFGLTLFNIVMDLKTRSAKVIEGLPTKPDAKYSLTF